ncbi:heavy-metal-associated domain-containing protein [Anaerotignum propionicum]|uniref:heavy-metal-associated domain-containing protein n=1 Tax=Anaerotignum propionicum TaxID=28446 RepID=UPI00210B1F0B|nr:copper resistance protein CopZ [Anaerotignum propionicum]MCQ4937309.1 copper resistance protein CopZ [Anaerotignum propionicum]
MKKIIFVEGMNHIQIGSAVCHILESVNGVDRVRLNLDEEAVVVECAANQVTDEELCDAINEEGFQVVEIFNEEE